VLIAVVSDTHSRAIPAPCLERLRASDLVLHAGDLSAASVLDELRALGPPVAAVHGNVDSDELRGLLPERQVVDAAGVRIGMVHDAGPAKGRIGRMRMAFPDCAAVVFGHSHIALHEEEGAFQIFNPGSPTDRRRQPRHSMGEARVVEGRVSFEHVWLD
jgi:putative phosphoesterase